MQAKCLDNAQQACRYGSLASSWRVLTGKLAAGGVLSGKSAVILGVEHSLSDRAAVRSAASVVDTLDNSNTLLNSMASIRWKPQH